MKKHVGKLVSLVLAIAMVLTMAVGMTAMAGETTNSLTVKNTGETAHTFELYQIFTGAASETTPTGTGKLANVEWGTGISEDGKTALYGLYSLKDEADKTAAKVAEKLAEVKNAEAFAAVAGANLGTATATSTSVGAGASFTFDKGNCSDPPALT